MTDTFFSIFSGCGGWTQSRGGLDPATPHHHRWLRLEGRLQHWRDGPVHPRPATKVHDARFWRRQGRQGIQGVPHRPGRLQCYWGEAATADDWEGRQSPLLPRLREGCTGRPLGAQLEGLDDVNDLPPVAWAAEQLHGASGTSHPPVHRQLYCPPRCATQQRLRPVPAQEHYIQAAALRRRRNPDAETPLQETPAAPPATQDGRLQLCRRPREEGHGTGRYLLAARCLECRAGVDSEASS